MKKPTTINDKRKNMINSLNDKENHILYVGLIIY
jgi:hypothetical protein